MFRGHISNRAQALRHVPLLADLDRRHLEEVANRCDEVKSEPGEVLVRQGETGRELILVLEGSVRVERDGRPVAHLGSGEFVGEMALLDGEPRSATVVTETPSTLLLIESRSFWPLLEANPAMQKKLLVSLAGRMRELQRTVMQ